MACHVDIRQSIPAPADSAPDRGRRGFTLVETLLALIILVILTGVVAMGVPVAFDTYNKAVNGSNAQVLLSTATTVLRDEMGLAQGVSVQDGRLYYVSGDGYWTWLESTDEGIVKHVYRGTDPGEDEADGSPSSLVSAAAQTDALRIQFSGVSYADGVFTVSGLQVVGANGAGAVLADLGDAVNDQYEIRAIMLDESGEGR